jgi:hypothetical protein
MQIPWLRLHILCYYSLSLHYIKIYKHKLQVDHVSMYVSMAPTANNDAFVWTWNYISQLGDIKTCASIQFYQLPNYLTLWGPWKLLGVLHEFGDWIHYKCKILDEIFIKLSQSIEYLQFVVDLWEHASQLWLRFFLNFVIYLPWRL